MKLLKEPPPTRQSNYDRMNWFASVRIVANAGFNWNKSNSGVALQRIANKNAIKTQWFSSMAKSSLIQQKQDEDYFVSFLLQKGFSMNGSQAIKSQLLPSLKSFSQSEIMKLLQSLDMQTLKTLEKAGK